MNKYTVKIVHTDRFESIYSGKAHHNGFKTERAAKREASYFMNMSGGPKRVEILKNGVCVAFKNKGWKTWER